MSRLPLVVVMLRVPGTASQGSCDSRAIAELRLVAAHAALPYLNGPLNLKRQEEGNHKARRLHTVRNSSSSTITTRPHKLLVLATSQQQRSASLRLIALRSTLQPAYNGLPPSTAPSDHQDCLDRVVVNTKPFDLLFGIIITHLPARTCWKQS
jgi:hypothetical protein